MSEGSRIAVSLVPVSRHQLRCSSRVAVACPVSMSVGRDARLPAADDTSGGHHGARTTRGYNQRPLHCQPQRKERQPPHDIHSPPTERTRGENTPNSSGQPDRADTRGVAGRIDPTLVRRTENGLSHVAAVPRAWAHGETPVLTSVGRHALPLPPLGRRHRRKGGLCTSTPRIGASADGETRTDPVRQNRPPPPVR